MRKDAGTSGRQRSTHLRTRSVDKTSEMVTFRSLADSYGDGALAGKWRHLERARLRIVSGDRGFGAGVAL
jgi:hypothetical protein